MNISRIVEVQGSDPLGALGNSWPGGGQLVDALLAPWSYERIGRADLVIGDPA
jgi:hypothetical protein